MRITSISPILALTKLKRGGYIPSTNSHSCWNCFPPIVNRKPISSKLSHITCSSRLQSQIVMTFQVPQYPNTVCQTYKLWSTIASTTNVGSPSLPWYWPWWGNRAISPHNKQTIQRADHTSNTMNNGMVGLHSFGVSWCHTFKVLVMKEGIGYLRLTKLEVVSEGIHSGAICTT